MLEHLLASMSLIHHLRTSNMSSKAVSLKTQELLLVTNVLTVMVTIGVGSSGLELLMAMLELVISYFVVHILQNSKANTDSAMKSKKSNIVITAPVFIIGGGLLSTLEILGAGNWDDNISHGLQQVTLPNLLKDLALLPQLCILHNDYSQANPMEGYLAILAVIAMVQSCIFDCYAVIGSNHLMIYKGLHSFLIVALVVITWLLRGVRRIDGNTQPNQRGEAEATASVIQQIEYSDGARPFNLFQGRRILNNVLILAWSASGNDKTREEEVNDALTNEAFSYLMMAHAFELGPIDRNNQKSALPRTFWILRGCMVAFSHFAVGCCFAAACIGYAFMFVVTAGIVMMVSWYFLNLNWLQHVSFGSDADGWQTSFGLIFQMVIFYTILPISIHLLGRKIKACFLPKRIELFVLFCFIAVFNLCFVFSSFSLLVDYCNTHCFFLSTCITLVMTALTFGYVYGKANETTKAERDSTITDATVIWIQDSLVPAESNNGFLDYNAGTVVGKISVQTTTPYCYLLRWARFFLVCACASGGLIVVNELGGKYPAVVDWPIMSGSVQMKGGTKHSHQFVRGGGAAAGEPAADTEAA